MSNLAAKAVKLVFGLMLTGLLVACGGGGGNSGTPAVGGGGGGGGGTGGGGTGTTPPPTMTIGLSSTTVTVASPATVTVQLLDRTGSPLSGQVIAFSSGQGLGKFSAPSALTDSNGLASVQISPNNSSATGADTVVATATVSDSTVTASTGFQLTATDVTLTSFTSDVGTSALAAYGQTGLAVNLGGASSGNPVNIVLTSSCVTQGKATLIPASATTTTGRASFTYRDNGCGALAASDALQATVTGTSLTSSLSIVLTQPTVSSITFVSSSPDTIYLKGSGFAENSNVKFKVVDANGNGVPEQQVSLEPTTLTGGLLIDGAQVAVTKRTDANGEVIARINSGTVPTPVRIKATLVGSSITTFSSNLAIAVGLPSQQFFSMSQGTINIEGYDVDGTPNTYQIISSDRLANPVPEGTSINFVAEGGQIQAVKQTVVANGLSSSVSNFVSSEPRPVDGRVTVVAYALGEESFLDANGNNVYDSSEDYQDLGDIFIDRLYNFGGQSKSRFYLSDRFNPSVGFNPAQDQFISLGGAGASACSTSVSPLLDLGISIPVKPGTCNPGWGRAYVRRAVETILSRSTPRLVWDTLPAGAAVPAGSSCPTARTLTSYYSGDDTPVQRSFFDIAGSGIVLYGVGGFSFRVADTNPVAFNPMPAGTVLSVRASDGLSATLDGGSPIPNTSDPTPAVVSIKFADTTPIGAFGTVTITTTTPKGLATPVGVSVVKGPLPAGYTACP